MLNSGCLYFSFKIQGYYCDHMSMPIISLDVRGPTHWLSLFLIRFIKSKNNIICAFDFQPSTQIHTCLLLSFISACTILSYTSSFLIDPISTEETLLSPCSSTVDSIGCCSSAFPSLKSTCGVLFPCESPPP